MRSDEDVAWLPLEMPGIFSLSAKSSWLRNKLLSMGLSGFTVGGMYRSNPKLDSVYEVQILNRSARRLKWSRAVGWKFA